MVCVRDEDAFVCVYSADIYGGRGDIRQTQTQTHTRISIYIHTKKEMEIRTSPSDRFYVSLFVFRSFPEILACLLACACVGGRGGVFHYCSAFSSSLCFFPSSATFLSVFSLAKETSAHTRMHTCISAHTGTTQPMQKHQRSQPSSPCAHPERGMRAAY